MNTKFMNTKLCFFYELLCSLYEQKIMNRKEITTHDLKVVSFM